VRIFEPFVNSIKNFHILNFEIQYESCLAIFLAILFGNFFFFLSENKVDFNNPLKTVIDLSPLREVSIRENGHLIKKSREVEIIFGLIFTIVIISLNLYLFLFNAVDQKINIRLIFIFKTGATFLVIYLIILILKKYILQVLVARSMDRKYPIKLTDF
jgi:hypothetical protein